jgi:serine/threonine-protein kinase RsbW
MKLSEKLQISSELKNVKAASAQILESLLPFNLSSYDLLDIRLCLEEALINAMKYGNKLQPDLSVEITYSIDDDILKITMRDEGDGFDYKNLPDPTLEENLQELKGRGVYLIRRLMDEVVFNEAGNQITMIKKLKKGD